MELIELLVNKARGGRFQLIWQLPTTSFLKDVLGNPLYAGAYAVGRRPIEVVMKDGQAVNRQRTARAAEDASIFIAGYHEGYLSWDTYQRHQDTVRGNGNNFMHDEAMLAVRSGQGLLVGLHRCARRGCKLHSSPRSHSAACA